VDQARRGTTPANRGEQFDVSVVIPLGEHDDAVGVLLTSVRALGHHIGGNLEVVLVDDGMPHGFEMVAARWRAQFAGLVVARHENRKGRGAAVRTGALVARGECVVVIDPSTEVPLENADQLLDGLRRGADIALVGRESESDREAQTKSFLERATETTIRRLSSMLVDVGVRDCFAGMFAMRSRAAKKIAQRSRVSGSAYPVEWLALGQYLGFQVVEYPLQSPRGPLVTERAHRGASPFRLLKEVWDTRRRFANDDYATSLHQSELLSDTSFRKLDRAALGVGRKSAR
jgi:glycosyltransferase involved in cell wall biosynthesis